MAKSERCWTANAQTLVMTKQHLSRPLSPMQNMLSARALICFDEQPFSVICRQTKARLYPLNREIHKHVTFVEVLRIIPTSLQSYRWRYLIENSVMFDVVAQSQLFFLSTKEEICKNIRMYVMYRDYFKTVSLSSKIYMIYKGISFFTTSVRGLIENHI